MYGGDIAMLLKHIGYARMASDFVVVPKADAKVKEE